MNISNNVLKYYLKNVYFLAGMACGGKSTMSKVLANKHGFVLVEENQFIDKYKEIANETEQPAFTTKFPDYETYFNRPPAEYSEWLSASLAEQLEMILMDLVALSRDKKVVVDIHISPETAKLVTEPSGIAFLVAEPELIIKDFYGRPDHKGLYDCIMGLANPEKTIENINNMITYGCSKTLDSVYNSGFFYIKRDAHSTVEKTLAMLEKHFGL